MNQLFEWLTKLFQGAKPWVIVLAWERGVRVRLGSRTAILEPGIHWRIPYLDEVRTINSRFRVCAFPCATVSTRDGRVMTCAGNIGFRVVDPKAAFLAFSQPDDVLAAIAQSSISELVARATFTELSVDEMEIRALAAVKEFADGKGLEVEFVRLVDFAAVRAIRLLQEQWRPVTNRDAAH